MRIGSGRFRGRKLQAPKGQETRPTGARLKKSLFDVLGAGLENARVLDLFAGAGALGLEALSRGAAAVVFVEKGRRAAEAIQKNIDELGVDERTELWVWSVHSALTGLAEQDRSFDLVFADPPYRSQRTSPKADELEKLLEVLGESSLVTEDGRVVVEHHHKLELGERYGALELTRRLKVGESCFTLYARVC